MTRGLKQRIPRDDRGAAMLAALCLAMVFAISLSSYLALCYTSLTMSTRAMMIAHSTELAETGVEQALYSINNSSWSSPTWVLTSSPTPTATAQLTMTSSGLVATSSTPTPLNYGNGMNGTVTITVTNYNSSSTLSPAPVITSTSYLTLPAYAGGSTLPTVSNTVTYNAATSALTAAVPLFVNAVAATSGMVRFKSAGTLDSYNSNPPSTSLANTVAYTICTPGTTTWTSVGAANNSAGTAFTATGPAAGTGTAYVAYNTTIAGYSAVVLSQDTASASATVRLNNAVLQGYTVGYNYVSPSTTNWLSYGGSGKVIGPNTAVGTSIDSSRLITEQTPYQPIFPENAPYSSGVNVPTTGIYTCSTDGSTLNLSATLGSTLATTPMVFNAGSGIILTSGQTVNIQGPVVIISYGGIQVTGTAGFQLTTPQASLQIFVEYGNVALGGYGITYSAAYASANPTQLLPKKVSILDTVNNFSTATISQTTPFYGVIYLPYMPITVTSSGAAEAIYGAIVGEKVTFSNSPVIHYDLALRYPMPAFKSLVPLQSGAAFDNLSAPVGFGSMVASSP